MEVIMKFMTTIGVNPGYSENNNISKSSKIVGELWQEAAEKLFEQNEIYVSAVISEAIVIYSRNWK